MKEVIIDRGIYKLGVHHANGKTKEPNWTSDITGNCLIIGHMEEPFAISNIGDIEFILKELSKRLDLKLISKVVKEEYGECYACSRCGEAFDNQDILEDGSKNKFCYNCGALLDWSNINKEDEEMDCFIRGDNI